MSISKDINIVFSNDSYKVIANKNIKKGEIILVETPKYHLFDQPNDNIKMLYLLLLNKDDSDIANLYPRKPVDIKKENNPYYINIIRTINTYSDKKIKNFLLNFNKETLNQYYYKYLFNAFLMNNKPAILPIGAMMNHSCTPNVKFYEKDICMYFETLCNIPKNTELCYSYLRNTKLDNTQDKLEYLLNHYNFICQDCKN
jgi:hypothetical protein